MCRRKTSYYALRLKRLSGSLEIKHVFVEALNKLIIAHGNRNRPPRNKGISDVLKGSIPILEAKLVLCFCEGIYESYSFCKCQFLKTLLCIISVKIRKCVDYTLADSRLL